MVEEVLNNDLAKELFVILSYCDDELYKSLPVDLLKYITDLAADSSKTVYIDENKSLIEQNISKECKELIGLLYYMYVADEKTKSELFNKWANNQEDDFN